MAQARVPLVVVVAGLPLAFGAGLLASRSAHLDVVHDEESGATDRDTIRTGAEGRSTDSATKTRASAQALSEGSARATRRNSRTDGATMDDPGAPEEPVGTAPEAEPDREPDDVEELRAELKALRDERRELLGQPTTAPVDLDPRFSSGALSTSMRNAIEDAAPGGDVEAVDCSEHPCIVFGRLEGDEEQMERIERSAALSGYRGDVLTLLFWATTASDEQLAAGVHETGLFAIAFYTREEQAEHGEHLERRLRARVLEYWNHDNPGIERH